VSRGRSAPSHCFAQFFVSPCLPSYTSRRTFYWPGFRQPLDTLTEVEEQPLAVSSRAVSAANHLRDLVKRGSVDIAIKFFASISNPTPFQAAEFLSALYEDGFYADAHALFDEYMAKSPCFEVLHVYLRHERNFFQANYQEKDVSQILSSIREMGLSPTLQTYNLLIKRLFYILPLASYPHYVMSFLEAMEAEGIEPDATTYTIAMEIYRRCGLPTEAMAVFAVVKSKGLEPPPPMFWSLVYLYSKYLNDPDSVDKLAEAIRLDDELGLSALAHARLRLNQPSEALKVVEQIRSKHPDLTAISPPLLNTILRVNLVCGHVNDAMDLFQSLLLKNGRSVDAWTLSIVFSSLGERVHYKRHVEKFYRQLMSSPLRNLINVVVFNSLLTACRIHRLMPLMKEAYEAIPLSCQVIPDAWSYTQLLESSIYWNDYEFATHLLQRIKDEGVRTDHELLLTMLKYSWRTEDHQESLALFEVLSKHSAFPSLGRRRWHAYNAVLHACLALGHLERVEEHFQNAVASGLHPEPYPFSFRAQAACHRGDLDLLNRVLHEKKECGFYLSVGDYNALLRCATYNKPDSEYEYRQQRLREIVNMTLQQMRASKIRMNRKTYQLLLKAYNHLNDLPMAFQMCDAFLQKFDRGTLPIYALAFATCRETGDTARSLVLLKHMLTSGFQLNWGTSLPIITRMMRVAIAAQPSQITQDFVREILLNTEGVLPEEFRHVIGYVLSKNDEEMRDKLFSHLLSVGYPPKTVTELQRSVATILRQRSPTSSASFRAAEQGFASRVGLIASRMASKDEDDDVEEDEHDEDDSEQRWPSSSSYARPGPTRMAQQLPRNRRGLLGRF